MSHILVTGGAGYIGSHTVSELINSRHKVIVYDNIVSGHRENVNPSAIFIEGDLSDKAKLNEVFFEFKIDAVIHFAAFAYVGESVKDPAKYYINNLSNALNLLNCMVENNVKKIVFSSTCAIFGVPAKVPISEGEQKYPINPYGRSKLFFESILEDYDKAYGLKSVCLRYFNAAGASLGANNGENHNPETHIIPLAINALSKGYNLVVYGGDYPTKDGTCIRDYIHVLDLASAHLLALHYLLSEKILWSKRYNLGSEKGYSVMEIIKTIEEVSGKRVNFSFGARREGDPHILVADSRLIKEELKWEPRFSDLKTIIRSAYSWHTKELKNAS